MNDYGPHSSFFRHLEHGRKAVFQATLCIFILTPMGLLLSTPVLEILAKHCVTGGVILHEGTEMEQLWVKVKLAIIISTFLGMPYIIFKIWSFIAPGLYYRKRVYILIMTLASCVLFVTGMLFCLYIIVPPIFNLSVWQDSRSLALSVNTSQFVNITAVQMMSFGLMFQVPAAVFLLVKSGLVHFKTLSRQRGTILVSILLLSALLTPPDVISQILMASATYLLFEVGLFITRIFMKRYKHKKHKSTDDIPDYSNAKDLVPTLLEQVLHTNDPETGPEVFAAKEKTKKRRKIRSIAR